MMKALDEKNTKIARKKQGKQYIMHNAFIEKRLISRNLKRTKTGLQKA